MPSNELIVSFADFKDCFVALPQSWASAVLDITRKSQSYHTVLELTWSKPTKSSTQTKSKQEVSKAYVGWSGAVNTLSSRQSQAATTNGNAGSSFQDIFAAHGGLVSGTEKLEFLEIDAKFGKAIGLVAGSKVSVQICKSVPIASTVNVEPVSEDDWEILELNADYIETHLLHQIKVVYVDQVIPVWVNKTTILQIRVADTTPPPTTESPCQLLHLNTEVIIAPKVRKLNSTISPTSDTSHPAKTIMPSCLLRGYKDLELESDVTDNLEKEKREGLHLTIHPQTLNVLLPDKDVENVTIDEINQKYFAKLRPIFPASNDKQSQQQQNNESSSSSSTPSTSAASNAPSSPQSSLYPSSHVPYLISTFSVSTSIPTHSISLSSSLFAACQFKRINLDSYNIWTTQENEHGAVVMVMVQLVGKKEEAKEREVVIKKVVKKGEKKQEWRRKVTLKKKQDSKSAEDMLNELKTLAIPLTNSCVVHFSEHLYHISFPSFPAASRPRIDNFISSSSTLTKLQISDPIVLPDETNSFLHQVSGLDEPDTPKMAAIDEVIENCVSYTTAALGRKKGLNDDGVGGILLHGKKGTGKSSILKVLQAEFSKNEIRPFMLSISCTALLDTPVLKTTSRLKRLFEIAEWLSPSIVFMDDLDKLIPAEQENTDTTRTSLLTDTLITLYRQSNETSKVLIIATVQAQTNLNRGVLDRGILSEIVKMGEFGRKDREKILNTLIKNSEHEIDDAIDTLAIANSTEGYVGGDLDVLLSRASRQAISRTITEQNSNSDSSSPNTVSVRLTQSDITAAMKGYTPYSLKGIKLQKESKIGWKDIGGLEETKKVLLETLEWPNKYAMVFKKCPLRLRSGILLYGYPGCGKTMLASAVAKECGLNFVSVKGPELLNKYIGASEKSVRDLFERASSAKPCILFFDEFDSIAPRRGHDNTGVTDRVVNQLLTMMDGAEGLEGVYVLAATSRPDLIDPALLRPGRLDKSLLCPLPDYPARLSILEAVASKLHLHSSISLSDIAEKTEFFSGADLQGLLYNAHLEAVHDVIEDEEGDGSGGPVPEKVNGKQKGEVGVDVEFKVLNDTEENTTRAAKEAIKKRISTIYKSYLQSENLRSDGIMNKESLPEDTDNRKDIVIRDEHILKSLQSMRPSISEVDRKRFAKIYDEFINGKTGGVNPGSRATLA
ncbi:P-loop containing nucleoside triphosphate hydrolase protein [Paraphysoderma sedebokerense]|nr:P-loop containing nucleoside triphosphate hydrolase protein [Paraphysoderma sedebokerense]